MHTDTEAAIPPGTVQELIEKDVGVEQHRVPDSDDERLGHPLLQRFINLPSSINFEVIIQASWESVATVFQFSLLNGGPASLIYGGVIAGFGATAVALSLAEMASIDPIVGAQYRWTANFAPFAPRFWGLVQGWITVGAWIFNAAGSTAGLANQVSALVIFNHPDYDPKLWHTAFFMWGFILIPIIFNFYFRRLLNAFETLGAILHVVLFIATIVTLTTLAERSSNDFVWKTIVTGVSGWKNPGVTFGIGLLSVILPLSGADGVLHMSAEVKQVRTRAPYSIVISTISNAIMQFAFVICLMYTVGDIQAVTNSNTGLPMIEVYYLATKSKTAANVFIVGILLVISVSLFNAFASVSRLTWSFACDHGLPFSSFFSKVNLHFRMPLNALGLIGCVCFLLSLIYIGSTTAFNAISSLNVIALHVSYMPPILFILLRKLRGPPIAYGPFELGRWGIPVNIFSLMYLVYVTMWLPFPILLPVTASNMNYAGPILLAVILGAVVHWFINGHKRFQFPVARYLPKD